VAAVCASFEAELIRAAGLVAGCSGGAGPGARLLLEALGCPLTSGRADLTLRLDPDGDRLELIDERDVALDPELTFALVVLALEARTVVKGADTSRMVDDLATERGGDVHVVPPGEVHLLEGLDAQQADVAGEGNGGVVVPAVGPARDGLAAAAAILALMARTGERLSELASVLPAYARRRSTVPCPDPATAYPTLEALSRRLRAERPADPESGVRIERGDGSWGLIRRSATEPVLRVTAEARTEAAAEALHAELHETLPGDYHAP
jgi:phosphomannomutase